VAGRERGALSGGALHEASDSRRAMLLLAGITAAAFVLRVWAFRDGLLGDEWFTYEDVHDRSLAGTIDAVQAVENSPPLNFVLAWLSAKIGDPKIWIRLPSLLAGTATVPLVYALGVRTLDRPAALIGAAFVGLSPFATFYSQEARPYALLMFLVVLSILALLHALTVNRPARWATYGATVLAVLLTHYTGVFVIAAQALWALWVHRDRWRSLALTYVLSAAAYCVWLPSVSGQTALGVVPKIAALLGLTRTDAILTWIAGIGFVSYDDVPGVPALVLLGLGLAVGIVGACVKLLRGNRLLEQHSQRSHVVLIVLLACVTPVALLAYAWTGSDLFVFPRNLSASFPFAALTIGWVLTRPTRPIGIVAVLLVGLGLGIATAKTFERKYRRTDFTPTARFIDNTASRNDVVIYYGTGPLTTYTGTALSRYYERQHATRTVLVNNDWQAVARRALQRGNRVLVVTLQHPPFFQPLPTSPTLRPQRQREFEGVEGLTVGIYEPRSGARSP